MEVVPRKERRKRFWQQKLAKKSEGRQENAEKPKTASRSDGRKLAKKPKHSGRPAAGKISRAPNSTSNGPQKLSSRGFRLSTLSTDSTRPLPPRAVDSSNTTTFIVDSESESSSDGEGSSERESETQEVMNTFSESLMPAAATGGGDTNLSNIVKKTDHNSKPTTKSKTRERKSSPIRGEIANSEPSEVSQSQAISQTGSEISENENETESGSVGPRGSRRYILFVGNLPYSAGEEGVVGHFKKRGVAVREVRMLTGKDSDSPRGCCFVELDGPKPFQNALRLHHTVMEGRKINVEMTCGGGGSSEGRRTRITRRNRRLLKIKTAKRRKLLRTSENSCQGIMS